MLHLCNRTVWIDFLNGGAVMNLAQHIWWNEELQGAKPSAQWYRGCICKHVYTQRLVSAGEGTPGPTEEALDPLGRKNAVPCSCPMYCSLKSFTRISPECSWRDHVWATVQNLQRVPNRCKTAEAGGADELPQGLGGFHERFQVDRGAIIGKGCIQ